jgi:DNA-directed RNA polymerase specialized sigma24 family protein
MAGGHYPGVAPESRSVVRTEESFTESWTRDGPRVLLYAVRRVGRDAANEILSETFLQAWRRWEDVPDPALPWLIGTARRVIANQRRGVRRRDRLEAQLRFLSEAAASSDDAGVLSVERDEALRRLMALTENEREAVLLVAWDGLEPEQAARVARVRPGAFRARLHRARKALERPADRSPSPQPLTAASDSNRGVS